MIVNKEFILDEEDIKRAIREYLIGKLEDPFDDIDVNFVYENFRIEDGKLLSLKLSAFVREEGCEC
jgi:hypothetical protein